MIYIACDMNCNNFGNFFKIVAHERNIKDDENSYIFEGGYYPKGHCYRCKPPHPISETFRYSEAIDILHPSDYRRWYFNRIIDAKGLYDELQRRESRKTDYLSRMDLMVIIDYLLYHENPS